MTADPLAGPHHRHERSCYWDHHRCGWVCPAPNAGVEIDPENDTENPPEIPTARPHRPEPPHPVHFPDPAVDGAIAAGSQLGSV